MKKNSKQLSLLNVVQVVYDEMHKSLIYIFQQIFNKGVFLEELRRAKLIPIFKKGGAVYLTNCRPTNMKIFHLKN